jgi:hypothetical protein
MLICGALGATVKGVEEVRMKPMATTGVSGKAAVLLAGIGLLALAATGCSKDEGLKIKRISPKSGPAAGGDPVTIYGSGFQKGGTLDVRVFFGKKRATVVGFNGDSELVVRPPGGKIGSVVDITVQFGDSRYKEIKKAYTYIDPRAGFGVDTLTGGKKKPGDKDKKK